MSYLVENNVARFNEFVFENNLNILSVQEIFNLVVLKVKYFSQYSSMLFNDVYINSVLKLNSPCSSNKILSIYIFLSYIIIFY